MHWIKHRTTQSIMVAGFALVIGTGAMIRAGAQSPEHPGSRAYLHSYNLPSSGLAIEGYCPVAYFTEGKPLRGDAQHEVVHNGVTYHLSSAEAKRAFLRNPERYLPAYGGWCAFGMAIADKFPVDPTQFKIVDGRLMLFLNNRDVNAAALWADGEESELVAKANANWNRIRS